MDTKQIHLNSAGDMIKEKIVYTASGPDDQDAELLSAEEIFERKDEDNIPW